MSNNQLSGTIPSTFGNLSRLSYLGLNDNKLTGIIPSTLGNMMQLTYLILFYNTNLTGTIPSLLCSIYGITINIDCPNISCTCCTDGTTYNSCNSTWTNRHNVRFQNIKMCCSMVYCLLHMVLSINTTFFDFLLVLCNQSVPCLYNAIEKYPIHSYTWFQILLEYYFAVYIVRVFICPHGWPQNRHIETVRTAPFICATKWRL